MNPPYWKDSEEIDGGFRPHGEPSFRPPENDFVVPHVAHPPQAPPDTRQQPGHVTVASTQHPTPPSTVSVNALSSGISQPRLSDESRLESSPDSAVDEGLAGTKKKVSSTKRAVQNRNAQRAFRQRREKYLKELEARVGEILLLHKKIDDLQRENRELRDYTMALQSELLKLTHSVNPDHKG